VSALSSNQPYPGLRPFDEEDRGYFFGRDGQTRNLRQKLYGSRLVAVVGRSGCGKSSLVRAGLVPLLAEESDGEGQPPVWRTATFKPQGRPMEELGGILLELTPDITPGTTELRRMRLDAMLRRSSQGLVEATREIGLPKAGRLLIIVDQFEEIFRFEDPTGSNTDDATAFVRLLTEAITVEDPMIHVMLTMRLDFLGDCARFPRLPEAISDGQFLVPTLSRAERRAAIEQPAKKAGKLIKPEVTQRLLNEIGDDPDQLPVLQHVLMRMWQQAGKDSEITARNYDDTGGVTGAISRHADQVYDNLPSATHRGAAERLFKAVSERDQRGRSIRHAMPFGEIAEIIADNDPKTPAVDHSRILEEVIDAFRAPDCSFLMPAFDNKLKPGTPIDISHESLLRGWVKLAGKTGTDGWIATEEQDGRTYAGLREAAKDGLMLSSKVAHERQSWWSRARPNAAWSRRYGNEFEETKHFLESSTRRAMFWRLGWIGSASLIFALLFALLSMRAYERVKDEENNAKAEALRAETVNLQARIDRLSAENGKLNKLIADLQPKLSPGAKASIPELSNLSEATAQRPPSSSTASGIESTLASTTGFLWLGSKPGIGNLATTQGDTVTPDNVKADTQYITNIEIYLREGAPDQSYNQSRSVGILPEGTLIKILGLLPPYTRPGGQQYWAKVHVEKLALFTVYFQFAGGSRDQAQAISRALQQIGYKVPGEERTPAAAGKREVRYFYAGQRAIAEQLVKDTNRILQDLGYSQLSVTSVLSSASIKSNPDGKVELWLELPSK
jgi:hypothetical protein